MSDLVFRTTVDRPHRVRGGGRGRRGARLEAHRGGGSGHRLAHLQAPAARRRACSGTKLMPLAAEGKALGVMLPNANGAVVTILGVMSAGRVPGDDQLHGRRREHPRRLQGRRGDDHRHLARLHREGQARRGGRAARAGREHRLPGGRARHGHDRRQAARPARLQEAAGRAQAGRSGGDPVHLGLGRHAEGRRALAPQHAGELPRRRPRASTSAGRTSCSTCCRCSTRSG